MGPPNHNDDIDMTGDDKGDTDQGDGPGDDKNGRKVSQTQATCATISLVSDALATCCGP